MRLKFPPQTISNMKSLTFYHLSIVLFLLGAFCAQAVVAGEVDPFQKFVQPVLQKRCVKCHGEGDELEGDVNLLAIKNFADVSKDPDLLSSIIDALEQGDMPPEDEPELKPKARKQVVTHLKHMLHEVLQARSTFSQSPIRRMNRFQYNNAVQDLFQLKPVVFSLPERMLREYKNYFQPQTGKMPANLNAGSRPLGKSQMIEPRLAGVGPFPQDLRAENGFDNRGDHLSLSPLLMESFMKLSTSIVQSRDFTPKNCGIWKTFFAPPLVNDDLENVVRQRLEPFLTHAFRRPVEEKLLNRYASHVIALVEAGEPFEASMKEAASAAIASPRFLYLYDKSSVSDKAEAIDDYELASRLSFFLWGSIPDQTLLDLAAAGTLHELEVLDQQVERMLKDRRLKRFCDSFPSQWLQLERIISSVPDMEKHPKFYFFKYRVSMHMMLEPLLLFETILIEDRSILELIDSDYSYRSDLLKAWYKDGSLAKTTPTSIPFKRVQLTDRRQGGVITNAAVLTMNSGPERSKPITRGAWIASVIFNDPPEPPPADVPPLPEGKEEVDPNMTIRERLAAHRKRADCAGCHEQIDPLGFALENYGPTGLWRDQYENGRDVDSAGVLFRKHEFNNIIEFKDAILIEKDRFARGFASHLLSFALARELNAADSPALDQIVSETKSDNYTLQAIIKQIVASEPFLHKYNPEEGTTKNVK